jgi:hypothetical protein
MSQTLITATEANLLKLKNMIGLTRTHRRKRYKSHLCDEEEAEGLGADNSGGQVGLLVDLFSMGCRENESSTLRKMTTVHDLSFKKCTDTWATTTCFFGLSNVFVQICKINSVL